VCSVASSMSAAAAVSAWFAPGLASRNVNMFLGCGNAASKRSWPMLTLPSICSISGGS
jgi:hypothetical protein